jgi:hypothetical protein
MPARQTAGFLFSYQISLETRLTLTAMRLEKKNASVKIETKSPDNRKQIERFKS